MAALEKSGWAENLACPTPSAARRVSRHAALLFEDSAEDSGRGERVPLLGLIPGSVIRLDPSGAGPWPHMGWNTLDEIAAGEPLTAGIEAGTRMYFVHGFYVPAGHHTVGFDALWRADNRHRPARPCGRLPVPSGAFRQGGRSGFSQFYQGVAACSCIRPLMCSTGGWSALKKGDFSAITDYGGDPVAVAKSYLDAGAGGCILSRSLRRARWPAPTAWPCGDNRRDRHKDTDRGRGSLGQRH